MTALYVIGFIAGYLFMGGCAFGVLSVPDDENAGLTVTASLLWPLTLTIFLAIGVFMLPIGIGKGVAALINRRANRAAELAWSIDQLERDNGIGGQR